MSESFAKYAGQCEIIPCKLAAVLLRDHVIDLMGGNRHSMPLGGCEDNEAPRLDPISATSPVEATR